MMQNLKLISKTEFHNCFSTGKTNEVRASNYRRITSKVISPSEG
jgi:hypothetical protein